MNENMLPSTVNQEEFTSYRYFLLQFVCSCSKFGTMQLLNVTTFKFDGVAFYLVRDKKTKQPDVLPMDHLKQSMPND